MEVNFLGCLYSDEYISGIFSVKQQSEFTRCLSGHKDRVTVLRLARRLYKALRPGSAPSLRYRHGVCRALGVKLVVQVADASIAWWPSMGEGVGIRLGAIRSATIGSYSPGFFPEKYRAGR
jgi:hypothetical protein